MCCGGEDGAELRLNLCDALKLQLKFLDGTIQLIPQIQEFLHLRR
jgi:hypothetical protein